MGKTYRKEIRGEGKRPRTESRKERGNVKSELRKITRTR